MNLQGKMQKKLSKKGEEYEVLILTFPNGYEKIVFLDNSEKFLINTMTQK